MISLTSNVTNGISAGLVPIWIQRITLDASTLRWATKNITLSGNLYSGDKVSWKGIKNITCQGDFSGGGDKADSNTYSFSTPKKSIVAGYNNFFPANSIFIDGRLCEVGVVFENATLESDITWLFTGNIAKYEHDYFENIFDVLDEFKLFQTELPTYLIQFDDPNNTKTYFPNAPKENFGKPLPIVYGDFETNNAEYGIYNYVPGVCTNRFGLHYNISHHALHYLNNLYYPNTSNFGKYSTGLNAYLNGWCLNSEHVNNSTNGAIIKVFKSDVPDISTNVVYANIKIQPKLPGKNNYHAVFNNAVDNSSGTTIRLYNTLALRIGGSESDIQQFVFNSDQACRFIVDIAAYSPGVVIRMNYFNPEMYNNIGKATSGYSATISATGKYYYDFAYDDEAKNRIGVGWESDELFNLDFQITIDESNSPPNSYIDIRNVYVLINDIIIRGTFKNWITTYRIPGLTFNWQLFGVKS